MSSKRWILLSLVATLAALLFVAARYERTRVPVDVIFTPTFALGSVATTADAIKGFDTHLQRPSGLATLQAFLPNQTGVLWLSLMIMLVAGFDYSQPRSGRNLDLLLAQAIGWCFMGSLDLLTAAVTFNDPAYRELIRLAFVAVTILTGTLAARTLWRRFRPQPEPAPSALPINILTVLAVFTVVLNLCVVFMHVPDDSSYFTSLGGQRLRERGALPYGDPMLTNTAGAAYAPLMYLAQAAAQVAVFEPTNAESPDHPVLGEHSAYRAPSRLSTQVTLAAFQLLAAGLLFVIGRRLKDQALGLTLVALYCGSAFVLGVGGDQEDIGGLSFVSHVIPPALTLAAFATLDRAALSGVLLAVAAASGFYPAFMFPAWLGYYVGRSRKDAINFALGFAVICVGVLAWVLVASRPAPGLNLVATIMRDTLGHHTDPAGYGSSFYGLWGQQQGVLGWLLQPLVAGSSLSSPFFLVFCAYLAATFVLARQAHVVGLAQLIATVAMGANIWKIHATGSYVTWYYPFLLIGILGPAATTWRSRSGDIVGNTHT